MTVFAGKPEAESIVGSDGDDVFDNILGADNLTGGKGSDVFKFLQAPATGTKIDGGTDGITDATVTPGATTTGRLLAAKVDYLKNDTINISSSMDIANLSFSHIETIQLADGVNLTMSAEQFTDNQESLAYTQGTDSFNPGLHVQGTVGGAKEKLTIKVDKGESFELDEVSTGFLFKDVDVTVQYAGGDVRYDGCAADETVIGGSGTDYVTPRTGNDTVFAGAGNDLLVGAEGADKLNGEEGDDIFLITRIATKANGGTFTIGSTSDGKAELVAGDVMDGGNGVDELRITAASTSVSALENTVTLTPDNFKNIEKVTIGTNLARDAKYATIQDQMAAGALTAVTTGTDKININGTALTAAVSYQGNDGDNNIYAGSGNDVVRAGAGNDRVSGGGGNDLLDGGTGTDTLVLGPASLADLKVFLGKDMITSLVNNLTGEHDSFANFEALNINGQNFDISFLEQPSKNLQNLGVLSQLLFNKAPGADIVASYANIAGDAKSLVEKVMGLNDVNGSLSKLSNAQFATLLVSNGLGNADQATIQSATDYLGSHSRADLVLVGIQNDTVVNHAFGAEGLALI